MDSCQDTIALTAAEPKSAANAAGTSPFDAVVAMLVRAVAGTVAAGAAFPTVLGLCSLVSGHGSEWIADGGFLFAFALLGGMVGGMLAFFVSVPVLSFAIVIAWLLRISCRDVWFASLIGGWTGFFATYLVIDVLPDQLGDRAVIAIAVATGQVGAGGLNLYARRKGGEAGAAEMRFGLRQLFGVTTAVAMIAAVSQMLKDSHRVFAMLDDAAIIQAAVIALALGLNAWRHRRVSPDHVSRATGDATAE